MAEKKKAGTARKPRARKRATVRSVAELKANPKNPRNAWTDSEREAFKTSLTEFGDLSGVVFNVTTSQLVGGHKRVQEFRDNADAQLHREAELKSATSDGTVCYGHVTLPGGVRFAYREVKWGEEKENAANIAANKWGASWDDDKLGEMLRDLKDQDYDLSLTGFDTSEFDERIADFELTLDNNGDASLDDAEPQTDLADELAEEWGTAAGQVWALGDHRLMCGDSTSADDLGTLMDGEKAGLCFTSPPYGQQRDYTEESDCSDWDGLMNGVFGNLPMTEEGQVLVNLGMIHREGEWIPYWDGWIGWMREQGWRRFGWYVWDQGAGMPGANNGRLSSSCEFVWHFNKQNADVIKWVECENAGAVSGASAQRKKDGSVSAHDKTKVIGTHRIPDSVIRVTRSKGGVPGHPAPFPVDLPKYVIKSWSGDIYEPFSGSGTTIIAAEQLGRKCYAMEISPGYVAVTLQRYEDATGKKPVLIG